MKLKKDYGAASSKGKVRSKNEDSILLSRKLDLIAVADGMGGHRGGEIASKMATDTIKQILLDIDAKIITNKHKSKTMSAVANNLLLAFKHANLRILNSSHKDSKHKGMGTTLTAALVHEDRVCIAHTGDCRGYLYRKNTLSQITTDHSLVNEHLQKGVMTSKQAKNSKVHHILTQALGVVKNPRFDILELPVNVGDILLLCSDGLFKQLKDEKIAKILSLDTTAQTVCRKLVEEANNAGGGDNISVAAVKFHPPSIANEIGHKIKKLLNTRNNGQ